jgi:hypothetical protein
MYLLFFLFLAAMVKNFITVHPEILQKSRHARDVSFSADQVPQYQANMQAKA